MVHTSSHLSCCLCLRLTSRLVPFALLHRGKNFDRTFTHPKCGVRSMYPKFGELLKLQAKYDPGKMLEPRLFRKVADRESFTYTPGCR